MHTHCRRHLVRGREVVHYAVQEALYSSILERGSYEYRQHISLKCGLADSGLDHIQRNIFTIQIKLCDFIRECRNIVKKAVPPLGCQLLPIISNIGGGHGNPFVGLVEPYLFLVQDINYTLEIILCSDREEEWHRVCPQLLLYLIHYCKEVGSHPVHLVHKGNPWNLIFFGLLPYCLGLRFNSANCTEYGNTTVQNTE